MKKNSRLRRPRGELLRASHAAEAALWVVQERPGPPDGPGRPVGRRRRTGRRALFHQLRRRGAGGRVPRAHEAQPIPAGCPWKPLVFATAGGGLLGPRPDSTLRRRRSGVRRGGLSPRSHQPGGWGAVLKRGRRRCPPAAARVARVGRALLPLRLVTAERRDQRRGLRGAGGGGSGGGGVVRRAEVRVALGGRRQPPRGGGGGRAAALLGVSGHGKQLLRAARARGRGGVPVRGRERTRRGVRRTD